MKYSEKLNGYWEEGYHYYLEFRNDHLTVRNYRRAIAIETTVVYDADRLESGARTVITLADNVLSRDAEGEMMSEIKELAYENGQLQLLYYYTIMGETHYTLTKKEEGPFDHIRIRDEEFLEKLQGVWTEWKPKEMREKLKGFPLTIKGNEVSWMSPRSSRFHVVSYRHAPEKVYLVPENLIDENFSGYTRVEVLPDMLTTTVMVCDMSMPLTVFAREDMLDKIEVPAAALRPPHNPMNPAGGMLPRYNFMGMSMMPPVSVSAPVPTSPNPGHDPESSENGYCPRCGYALATPLPRFCPECGTKL